MSALAAATSKQERMRLGRGKATKDVAALKSRDVRFVRRDGDGAVKRLLAMERSEENEKPEVIQHDNIHVPHLQASARPRVHLLMKSRQRADVGEFGIPSGM